MATSTTIGTVRSQLVTSLGGHATLASVDVTRTWRPWGDADQVFLGNVEGESRIPNQKAGRKQRQESYSFDVVFRTIDNDGTPQTGDVTEDRCITYLAALDDVLADDPQIDGLTSFEWATVGDFSLQNVPRSKGWGCQITVTVEVEARLT